MCKTQLGTWKCCHSGITSFLIQLMCHTAQSSQSQQWNPKTYILTMILSATVYLNYFCFTVCYINISQHISLFSRIYNCYHTGFCVTFSEEVKEYKQGHCHPSTHCYGVSNTVLPSGQALRAGIRCQFLVML